MATYQSNDIQPNTIAMLPVHSYVTKINFSPDSIRWLDYVASTQGVHIQHALNGRGERKISGLSVDGFCEETNTIYQYQVNINQPTIIIIFVILLQRFLVIYLSILGLLLSWM